MQNTSAMFTDLRPKLLKADAYLKTHPINAELKRTGYFKTKRAAPLTVNDWTALCATRDNVPFIVGGARSYHTYRGEVLAAHGYTPWNRQNIVYNHGWHYYWVLDRLECPSYDMCQGFILYEYTKDWTILVYLLAETWMLCLVKKGGFVPQHRFTGTLSTI